MKKRHTCVKKATQLDDDQMITNVGRWIFSRSSLGVLLMFSGFFQDVLKGLVSVVGLGGLVSKPLVV